MCALLGKLSTFVAVIAVIVGGSVLSVAGGASSLHAGFVGTYAGQLSGGEALSAPHSDHGEEGLEAHDFSAASSEHIESLGDYGQHLSEQHFPQDFGSSAEGAEYAEAAASEHHAELEHHYDGGAEFAAHGDFGGHDDFDSKPVPGIDHGKGAFSYSSTYEFKDKPEDHSKWL